MNNLLDKVIWFLLGVGIGMGILFLLFTLKESNNDPSTNDPSTHDFTFENVPYCNGNQTWMCWNYQNDSFEAPDGYSYYKEGYPTKGEVLYNFFKNPKSKIEFINKEGKNESVNETTQSFQFINVPHCNGVANTTCWIFDGEEITDLYHASKYSGWNFKTEDGKNKSLIHIDLYESGDDFCHNKGFFRLDRGIKLCKKEVE